MTNVTFNPPLEAKGNTSSLSMLMVRRATCSGEITTSGSKGMPCSRDGWDIDQTFKGEPGEGGAIDPVPRKDILGVRIWGCLYSQWSGSKLPAWIIAGRNKGRSRDHVARVSDYHLEHGFGGSLSETSRKPATSRTTTWHRGTALVRQHPNS
jgi:hypothetical protein